jgi:hypothetical protein
MALLENGVNLYAAVFDCYGCKIPAIPEDGVLYSFPIDRLRIGYVINLGNVSMFGCRADGDNYYFDGESWHGYYSEPAKPAKQELNRMVIECARGLLGRGEVLDIADSARLKLAVQQVEASS